MRDQRGRVFVVTGGSSGIGAAAAAALLEHGATVVVAARDVEKARRALGDGAEVHRVDLGDLSSVRSFAAVLADRDIDVLINNAGVMAVPYGTTVDGFETHFGTNFFGPFALTGLVLPRLRDRVVMVSSVAHVAGSEADLDDPYFRTHRYDAVRAYNSTKLANLLFAYELNRRLVAAGSRLRSLAAHPGLARSDLLRAAVRNPTTMFSVFAVRFFGQSAAAGALPLLHAATEDLPGGTYVGPAGRLGWTGAPAVVRSSRTSMREDLARRLWELSERETGVRIPLV